MASKAATIVTALKTALQANHPGTVYPPDVVQPVLFWPDEKALDPTLTTIYLIRPGEERGGPGPTGCEVTENLEIFILAARRYTSASDDPFKEDPPRWQVSADLVADVKEKLRQDEKLGSLAITVFAGPAGGQASVDHERYLPRWVVPELRTIVRYRYEKSDR
jgi:hypothetical protein